MQDSICDVSYTSHVMTDEERDKVKKERIMLLRQHADHLEEQAASLLEQAKKHRTTANELENGS